MSFADVGYRFRYMEWAKTVMEAGLPGMIDVGSSGIARVSLRELGVRLSDLELFGPHFYGEPVMRRSIARMKSVAEERVLPVLGASYAHFLVCAALIEPGDEAIVETPGYEVLSALPRALGARVVPLPRRFENGFQFDPAELRRLVTKKTRLVLVTNLHNPSGVALPSESLSALAELAGGDGTLSSRADRAGGGRARSAGRPAPGAKPKPRRGPPAWTVEAGLPVDLPAGPWVVVNEVYRDFLPKGALGEGHSLGPRGVSLGSLTKVYGLGETRVGWIVAHPALVHRASRVGDFAVVNGPYIAERVGAIALARRTRLLGRTRGILRRNRPILEAFLRATPALRTVPTEGGTIVFPRVRGIEDTAAFASSAMHRHRVCVVPGEFFGMPGHIRIGIGLADPKRLAEGLRRLGAAIAGIPAAR